MKVLVQRTPPRTFYAKALNSGKLVFMTGAAQTLVQGLGLLGGILIIRLLPTQEYALYTLANTMLGTMIILADGGISTAVMAQGGKVWQEPQRLGLLLATGLDLRRKFAIGSLLVATPALLLMLRHHGASWLAATLIVAALVPAFLTALSNSLLQVVPKLRQDISPLQKNDVLTSVSRLALLGMVLFPFSWAFVAILASGLPQIWANLRLRKISAKYLVSDQSPDPEIRRDILAFVKRVLPGSIYYCLSGQITIWLISIFGSTTAVAQIGALGRLVMVLTLVNSLFGILVLPRFARLPNKAGLLLSRYLLIQGALLLLSGAIIGLVWLFPAQVLWILGKAYTNLDTEVVLNIANSCLAMIAGASFALSSSRGWAIHPLISLPVTIGALAGGIALFDMTSLSGVLTMNIFVALVEVVMYFVYNMIKIVKLKPLKQD